MRVDGRRRTAAVVLGALVVLAVPTRVAFGMRSSALAQASDVRQETASRQIELNRAKKAKANQPKLQTAFAELVAAMPATPDQQSLLDTLSALAAETSVSWEVLAAAVPQTVKTATTDSATTDPASTGRTPDTSLAPASADSGAVGAPATVASSASTSFTFDATVSGDDASVSAFLDRLRSIDRLVVVDKVQLSWNRSTTGAGGGVNARLSMRAFIWKGAAKAGASTGSTTTASSVAADGGDQAAPTTGTVATTVAP